jgi:hypothetical protein
MISTVRSLDRVGALAGVGAAGVLTAGVLLGSRRLRDFDPVLLTYTFGVVFSAAVVAYRFAVWLRRPPTRILARRGLGLFLRGNVAANALYVLRLLGNTFAAQRFIRNRSLIRWITHALIAWGTMIAAAVTFPLVFGWLHFESRKGDPSTFLVVLFGLPVGAFGADSPVRYLMFNLLNISAVMVIAGVSLAIRRRLGEPAALARQQFGNDLIPLLLLLAISLTGLALTFSAHALRGEGYPVLSLIHALAVSVTLLYLPFGKLFHAFQRPLHLAVLLRRRDEPVDRKAACVRCGDPFAGADHVGDLAGVLRESGLALAVDLCPRCKRRRLGRAQRVTIEKVRSHG